MLIFVAVPGCGGGVPTKGDEKESDRLISIISMTGNPQSWKIVFAEGSVPADSEQEKYQKFMYVGSSVKISGDTATASVRVQDQYGQMIGSEEMEWTFKKDSGGAWKLTDTPLPSGT
jgi:hypothetical protein